MLKKQPSHNMEYSMLKIVFKNMESSQFAKDIVEERIDPIVKKFPALSGHKITITLEMENSPSQAGPDLFSVTSIVSGKTFKNLKVKKSSDNFYHALAEHVDCFSELLSQESDRLLKKNKQKKLSIGA